MKRHHLLELQWQGRDGRFRHIALSPPGVRRVLGTVGIVALFALAAVSAISMSMGSNRTLARSGVDSVLRENAELKARQEALRERAFDLAEQLYRRVEQGRRMVWMADTPGHAWEGQCPRPPARGSGDEVTLAWLSEQGTRLEVIGNELPVGRVQMGLKVASISQPNSAVRPDRAALVGSRGDRRSAVSLGSFGWIPGPPTRGGALPPGGDRKPKPSQAGGYF